ncbi:protein tyrosine kinase [Nitzschia inconspicua]|uniref:Protein tyrosine kinase n=1 Tax=Nitzschia inconspicua TaxID=303405 RepID=A0A9K3L9R4_9STRA|nr:protein tyrosine kinase [Nitzschia inconspicua]
MGCFNSKDNTTDPSEVRNLSDTKVLAMKNFSIVHKQDNKGVVARDGNIVAGNAILVRAKDSNVRSLHHYYRIKKVTAADIQNSTGQSVTNGINLWNELLNETHELSGVKLNNEYLVKVVASFETGAFTYIQMENFRQNFHQFRQATQDKFNAKYVVDATQFMIGICRALSFMHGMHCYHRNVSSTTCVIVDCHGKMVAKLCGLETAVKIYDDEISQSELKSLDILRAGVVAFELYKGPRIDPLEEIPPNAARNGLAMQSVLNEINRIGWEGAFIDACESCYDDLNLASVVRAMIFGKPVQPSAYELYTQILNKKSRM